MASIVKANPSLTSGGLVVLRRSFSTTDDGTCNYEADYCCLAAFASNHAAKFRTESVPPTPILPSMSQLRLIETPTLHDVTSHTENGLTYFSARYSAASNDGSREITTTTDLKSFSGSVVFELLSFQPGVTTITNVNKSFSFDYYSTSTTTEGAVGGVASAGSPFNIRGISPGAFISPFTVVSSRTYRNNLGVTKNQVTRTGIYIQTVFVSR